MGCRSSSATSRWRTGCSFPGAAMARSGVAPRWRRPRVDALRPQFSDLCVGGPRWARPIWWALEAEVAVAAGDAVRCREVRTQLGPLRGRWAVLGGGVIVRGPVDHWLAVLHLELGDLDAAM